MKRLLSFVLVLMFSLSLIIPAFAAADESVIMPRNFICPQCQSTQLRYQTITQPKRVYEYACPNHSGYYHVQIVAGRILICPSCDAYGGADTSKSYGMISCTYTGTDCFNPNPQFLWGSLDNVR